MTLVAQLRAVREAGGLFGCGCLLMGLLKLATLFVNQLLLVFIRPIILQQSNDAKMAFNGPL